jgi:nitrous oxidase accessory protein NosD
VKHVRGRFALALILIVAASSLLYVSRSEAQSFGTVFVRSDGSIEPSTAPIQRIGEVYLLSGNLYDSPIVLEKNSIVVDGGGYALEGAGSGIALNLTCSNVTVRNLQIVHWEVGILGAYNNNTVRNCFLTGNEKGIAIYADNYTVTGNTIANSTWGIRMKGNGISVTENQLRNNGVGIWVTTYEGYSGNTVTYNSIEVNEQVTIETDMGGGFEVHHNNFIINNVHNPLVSTAYLPMPGNDSGVVMPPWDNGAEGNYWSNYAAKYPDAKEKDTSGIGDTPYVINVAPNLTDRFPLIKPLNLPAETLPTLEPSPSPTPSPSPSISPPPTAFPSPALSANPLASPTPRSVSAQVPSISVQPTQTPQSMQGTLKPEYVFAFASILAIAIVVAVFALRKRRSTHSA